MISKTYFEHLLSSTKKVIHYTLSIILISLLIFALIHPHLFKTFLDWIAEVVREIGFWNYPLVAMSGILESLPVVGVLFPGQNVVIIIGGFFGRHHLFELIAIATIGVYLGHAISYWLGEKYGIQLIDEYGPTVGFGKTEAKYLEEQIQKRGGAFLILGTFHNVTRAFVPFIAGCMKMDKRRFAFYNFLGSLLWAVVVIVVGVMFGQYYELVIKKLPWILWWLMVLLIGYVALFKKKEFLQYLEEKEQEKTETEKLKNEKTKE